jgi:hypothetical protein
MNVDEAVDGTAVVAGDGADDKTVPREAATTQVPTSIEMREP